MPSQYISPITEFLATLHPGDHEFWAGEIYEKMMEYFEKKLVEQSIFKNHDEIDEFFEVAMENNTSPEITGIRPKITPRSEEIKKDPRYQFIAECFLVEVEMYSFENLAQFDLLFAKLMDLMKQKITWDEKELELKITRLLAQQEGEIEKPIETRSRAEDLRRKLRELHGLPEEPLVEIKENKVLPFNREHKKLK